MTASVGSANRVVQRNIRDILTARQRIEERQSRSERFAAMITRAAGSIWFAYAHIAWFAAWSALNFGLGNEAFDPFPFVLLTTIVSLEAIFLTLMVLVSQNREAQLEEQRADLDLQIDLLAEHEVTRLLSVVNAIARKVGVDIEEEEMRDLEKDVRPRDLLDELARPEDATS
jgi:uncharacterized membrane protein